MSSVNISDLNLHTVILALWRNMEPASFFTLSGLTPPGKPSHDEIDAQLGKYKSLDYLAGRCIKTNFSNLEKVNTYGYNRDAGDGAFERIVDEIRRNNAIPMTGNANCITGSTVTTN